MARINLLPWRAERRKQRQRDFYGMLGFAAIGGLLLSLMIWFYYDRQVSGQGERNAFLQTEIDKVKEQNKEIDRLDRQKERLLARKKVIEELQAKRSQMVHLFDALVRTIPDGVVLTALKQEGDILTLQGRTQSNARVSAYMRNLESSGWMSKPELSVIEAKKPEAGKDGPGPVTDISALPYMFEVKVTLPAQSEPVGGVGPDGSVVVPADAAAIPADPAAAPAPAVAPLSPAATPASTPPAAAPAPAAEPSKPSGSRIAPPAAPAQPTASSTPQKGGA
ncbi:PilN domain-containing protein [Stenotrophomonas rhizophila]|uniref:PilN domain-containing protein n=1 Tax=Stenotrophomonas rhizophila TaxID=216778 RepID=UPI000456977D|nr:PilN domain-containing protein [Stenotrophomonas rhizophila]AHY57883.1 fimbrial protein [Stenotrophomonas rhizophila]